MERIGFAGLGAMGSAMAMNIRKAGYPLTVWNRSQPRTEPFRSQGIAVADSPRALAQASDTVVIMVTDPAALHAVLHGTDGVLAGIGAGKVIINMSTVSPEATRDADERVRAAGALFVDAPVSGSVKPAQEGTLVVLAGGDDAALERATPLLRTMGREVVPCGGAGQGTRMKLVLNLMLGDMMQALAEAMTLGGAFRLDATTVLKAIGNGAMAAPMFQLKGKMIAARDYAPQFPVHLMYKDLNLVLAAAGEAHVPLPQTAATRECFNAAMALGHGDEDMAAVARVMEGMAPSR